MKKITYGYLLVLELVPSTYFTGIFSYLLYARVIGALMIYFGLKELKNESHHIKEILDLTLLLSIVTFLLVTVEIVNRALLSGILITLISILIDIVLFFITYKLILGIQEIEITHAAHLNSDKMLLAFLYIAVLHLAHLIFVFEPIYSATIIGYTLGKVFFLVRLFTICQQYQQIPNKHS